MIKLKPNISFKYDDEKKAYIFSFDTTKKPKKVSSRFLSILLGKNSYNSVGYGILERNRMLEDEKDIEIWYKIRGAIAEYFAEKELKKQFSNIEGIQLKRFATNQFKHYDQFHEDYSYGNDKWGGTVDIAISKPDKLRGVVEVKGKSMYFKEKLDELYLKIKQDKNFAYNDDEILQGLQLGVLSKVDNLIMAYVLFDKVVETKIQTIVGEFIHVDNFTDKEVEKAIAMIELKQEDLTYVFKHIKIDYEKVQELMQTAYDNLQRLSKTGVIPKIHFTQEEQNDLNKLLDIDYDDGLPF
jgi:hypothetical protein